MAELHGFCYLAALMPQAQQALEFVTHRQQAAEELARKVWVALESWMPALRSRGVASA